MRNDSKNNKKYFMCFYPVAVVFFIMMGQRYFTLRIKTGGATRLKPNRTCLIGCKQKNII